MAKHRYWNGDNWEVIGTESSKVSVPSKLGVNTEEVLEDLALPFRTERKNKDSNGVFTVIESKRKSDGTLATRSTLSGGSSPNYTKRTIERFARNGTTKISEDTFTINYDDDGDYISED